MSKLESTLSELPLKTEAIITGMPEYWKDCRRLREIGGICEGVTTVERLSDPFPCKDGPIRIKIGQTVIALCYKLAQETKVKYIK